MSTKTTKVQSFVAGLKGGEMDPRYLGFFDCFNHGRYFEAHEVLEDLWLEDRLGSNGAFYKGLIQLAAAFVHLEKNRLGPAAALFDLARANLEKYPSPHERLDLSPVVALTIEWRNQLVRSGFTRNPLNPRHAPKIAADV